MFEENHTMPTNDSGAQWDAKFKGFLKKAGEDFKRTAGDVKKEAERQKVAEFTGEVDEKTIIHAFAGSEA